MNLRGVLTIFRKDLKSSYKNKTILLIILMPILISIIVNGMLNAMVSESDVTPVGIYDRGNNQEFIQHLNSTGLYHLKVMASGEELDAAMKKGEIAASIEIPAGFSEDLKQGSMPFLNVTVDSSNLKSAAFLHTYREAILDYAGIRYPVNIALENMQKDPLAQFSVVTWIVFSVILIGVTILPHTLATEKEKRTLDAVLTSPVSEAEVICGKSLYGIFITVAISLLVLVLNHGLAGNLPLTLLFILLGSVTFTGIGLLIGALTNTHSTASIVSSVVMLPFMLLSLLGTLSKQFESLAYLSPGTYMQKGITEALLNNAGIGDLWLYAAVLGAISVAIYVLAVLMIKRRRSTP